MKIPISKNFFGDEEFEAIQQPLKDGWITQGAQVREFERRFLHFIESKHAIACSSGTAALHIGLITMGVSRGDEVIVPGFTWVATANVVEAVGGVPVFCDVNLGTFNMDVESLHHRITDRTVGIIPVHLFGLCADMARVQEVARKHNLWVIEDAACAVGSQFGLNDAGTMGDLGCFSFHPRKTVTTGEGGMVITEKDALAESCAVLRNHGTLSAFDRETRVSIKPSPSFSQWGLNYRMTDFQGAVGVAQMERIQFLLSERRRCAEFYEATLTGISWLRLPKSPGGYTHSWQSYVILFEPEVPSLGNVARLSAERNRFMQILQNAGIATRQGTHAPVHLPYYKNKYNSQYEDYPNAWLADQLSITLPVFPRITEQELDYVMKQIKSFQPAI